MLLTLLSPILGALASLLPNILVFFEKAQQLKHEKELLQLQMEAQKQGVDLQIKLEEVKALIKEGDSLREHDMSIQSSPWINNLRASVRPIITYFFFFLFCAVKISAIYMMIQAGAGVPELLIAIWDDDANAMLGVVLGFWFGSRTIEKRTGIGSVS